MPPSCLTGGDRRLGRDRTDKAGDQISGSLPVHCPEKWQLKRNKRSIDADVSFVNSESIIVVDSASQTNSIIVLRHDAFALIFSS
jgi:hypothetical protein